MVSYKGSWEDGFVILLCLIIRSGSLTPIQACTRAHSPPSALTAQYIHSVVTPPSYTFTCPVAVPLCIGVGGRSKDDKKTSGSSGSIRLQDHYLTLELPHDFTGDELKQNFRRLSRTLHPDKKGGSTDACVNLPVFAASFFTHLQLFFIYAGQGVPQAFFRQVVSQQNQRCYCYSWQFSGITHPRIIPSCLCGVFAK